MKKIHVDDPVLLYSIASLCRREADTHAWNIVRKWLSEDAENEKVLEYLMHTSFMGEVDESEATRDMLFLKIMERIRKSEENSRRKIPLFGGRTGKNQKRSIVRYASTAAVLLLLILGGIFLFPRPGKGKEIVVYGRQNEVVEITLNDGSIIALNAGSTLSYPKTFHRKERRVKLEGEAYFDVTRNEKKPFMVELSHAEVRVLGTRFNVKSYGEEKKIITTLLEGSVLFRLKEEKKEPLLLKPDQQVVCDLRTGTCVLNEVETALYTTWKEGRLYFENVDLDEIARMLERHFGVPVENNTTRMEGQYFSGMFEKETSLLQILDMLKRHRAFDYENKNGKIRLFDI